MLTILTFFSTALVFLFQHANATFQPANRINPDAPDQQDAVSVHIPLWVMILGGIFFFAVGFGCAAGFVLKKKAKVSVG